MNIYREVIMDHYKNPRNFGKLEDYDLENYENNPLCGDELKVFIKLDGEKIKDIKFEASGCAISIATSSILTEHLIGKEIEDGKEIEEIENLKREDILNMINIDLSVSRIKCAMLSLLTIKNALNRRENVRS